AFAAVAAERGHQVSLFEKSNSLGGQFNLAKRIPGKEDFQQTINYFLYQLTQFKVTIHLNTQAEVEDLRGFDEVILATGILPRITEIEGIDHEKVMTYVDLIQQKKSAGKKVAIIGSGGIGFDVAHWLTYQDENQPEQFYAEWGIDTTMTHRGGVKKPEL